MTDNYIGFPQQQLSLTGKTKKWRKQCVDWGTDQATITYNPVRKSLIHKKINYDLLNGILHMQDLEAVINPHYIEAGFIPDRIPHYPIMNAKLNILRGEESKRVFDFKVVVTNPNAVSEIEEQKKQEVFARLQQTIMESAQSQEELEQKINKLGQYYTYQYQDIREIRGNAVLQHYMKEYNIPFMFNQGFMDAMAVGEEIYQCDIIGGEPVVERLNPLKVRVFKSGYSNRIEDADMIILEDYWSPGRIIDTYYDVLTQKDIKYIEQIPFANDASDTDSMDNIDERRGFVNTHMIGDVFESQPYSFDPYYLFSGNEVDDLLPYDLAGNIRVCRVFWKSRRKIKEVKSYDFQTGEEIFNFYPETYVINKDLGEEEKIFWVNEAWEGTKIGSDVYVNMRPRPVQYNRLSNPSKCHFGIIGSIYNLNDDRPFSMVDMMKQYNYLYDAIHDRLNKLMARNWGKIVRLDLARVPTGWNIEKWMYYGETMGLAVEDSFKEGNIGAATGKIAGALNNNSTGVIDAELGNSIQQNINLLEFIKLEMSEVVGITKQREGQIANRETVGGVERATLQSSHITEWVFTIHEDLKKRVLECLLETAKITFRGRSKKIQYILPDFTQTIVDIDGDEFAECDYGLVVDNSAATQDLSNKIDMLAQAALQNQTLSFSTIMDLYSSASLAEKKRMVQRDEEEMRERAMQAQQEQLQAQQQQAQMEMEAKQQEMQMKDQLNMRDNETKILVATISAKNAENDGIKEPEYSQEAKDKLLESMRQFDARLKLDRDRLEFDKKKASTDARLKEKQINKKTVSK